ncbi:MAG: glutamate decarboxylase, partial [Bacteriovoracales bacterium]
SPETAYRIVQDEMNLEGNPSLNMATFVTTWMEKEAEMLIMEGARKNLVDEDEYPQLKIIENRIIQMEAHLFNAPKECKPVGFTTVGSSEAIMLGLLAHKWKWRQKRKAEKKSTERPNIICGADVHTCWEKFARYFDVELKLIPFKKDKFIIGADDVEKLIDENTITVGVVMGTTFTGQLDEIQKINDLLIKIKKQKKLDIPIHVDAASGGFILPFIAPEFEWDFRLEQVRSINVSNHKFGMVYAGLGSIIFKDESDLPKDLPFKINYLGGSMDNYSLNFSKGSSMLLAQYYLFLRLGRLGYEKIQKAVMINAHFLEKELTKTGIFKVLTESKYLPVVVVKSVNESKYNVFKISDELKKYGWIIPAYTLPPNAQKVSVLRLVVKENFSRDMAIKLVGDIKKVIKKLK